MSAEVPLQMNMFDEEMSDTRTRKQKRAAKKVQGFQQEEMFSQRELAQWGVRLHPMDITTPSGKRPSMQLEIEDPRTDEQKALDLQREAEELTHPLPQVGGPPPGEGRGLETVSAEVVLSERG